MLMTMNNQNKDRLLIFDYFEIDYNLPKFKKDEKNDVAQYTAQYTGTGFMQQSIPIQNEPSIIKSLWNWVLGKKEKIKTRLKQVPVKYVFECVLKNPEELEMFNTKSKEYEKMIENAKLTGQVALVEELQANKELKNFENQLVTLKMTKYISEKNLLKFSEHCIKGLKLDYIKNFTRIIPNKVIQQKIKCDEYKLFDNYVVLYYDPTNTSTQKTNKEKDPILFGIMRGSRKLYFIGDWQDELCDLTFDQVIKVITEKETTLL